MRPPDPHSRALGILKYAKSFLLLESMKKYRKCGSTVEPHFRYCCSVWGCCRSTGINHLQKLHKGAARIVTSSSIDAPSRPVKFKNKLLLSLFTSTLHIVRLETHVPVIELSNSYILSSISLSLYFLLLSLSYTQGALK